MFVAMTFCVITSQRLSIPLRVTTVFTSRYRNESRIQISLIWLSRCRPANTAVLLELPTAAERELSSSLWSSSVWTFLSMFLSLPAVPKDSKFL